MVYLSLPIDKHQYNTPKKKLLDQPDIVWLRVGEGL